MIAEGGGRVVAGGAEAAAFTAFEIVKARIDSRNDWRNGIGKRLSLRGKKGAVEQ
jgi:hypothetical protein